MYFLFNTNDDSYNCSSNDDFPDYMLNDNVYKVEVSQEQVDAIAEDSITFVSYNTETNSIYLDEQFIFQETVAGKIKMEEAMKSILLIPEDERTSEANGILEIGNFSLDAEKLDTIYNSVDLTDEDSEAILNYLDTAE